MKSDLMTSRLTKLLSCVKQRVQDLFEYGPTTDRHLIVFGIDLDAT